jgi:hypothetical protein
MDNQQIMVQVNPERFFVPAYVTASGWVGVWLNRGVEWNEVASVVEDGYRLVAGKRLGAELDGKRSLT